VLESVHSFIQDKSTGETIPLKRKHGVWVLEVWAERKPNPPMNNGAGFHWQG
jgi:hypothetical protein